MEIKDVVQDNSVEKPNYVSIIKSNIICNPSDSTGCGFIRTIIPFTYITSVFGRDASITPIITQSFIRQPEILLRTRSILFQRFMSKEHEKQVRYYKDLQDQFKYKMVSDLDDWIWGQNENQGGDKYHGIPAYNFACNKVSDEMKESLINVNKMCDVVTVSTEQLARSLKPLIGDTRIEVLQNTVPVYLWGRKERLPESCDIKKPRVLFNASPTHYSNENKLKGDLDNAWLEWIIKSVEQDEIDLYVMGGFPYLFETIRHKVKKVYEWMSMLQYPYVMKMLSPHFVISPLVPNEFNSCKSDIKKIEAQAVGAIHIGTVFNDRVSPYDNNLVKASEDIDVNGIDELFKKYCDRDLFNATVQLGYRDLDINNRWTESTNYIDKICSIF